ncbi:EcsC family protein [Clostridium sp. LBM24168]
MGPYEDKAFEELLGWQEKVKKKPGLTNDFAKTIQNKMNSIIPEKVNIIIADSIKNMVKAVIYGSGYKAKAPLYKINLKTREDLVREKIEFYKKTAALSGAGTGGAGILVGLADFPILLGLKMKFLFDTAGVYGFNMKNYKERLYMLYIFQIAFSSDKRRIEVYDVISDWDNYAKSLPEDKDGFDWKTFQQEYRDYIDIAKMLQLVPGIGAVVGAYANYRLMDKLGYTAMNSYRLRIFKY